MSSRQQIINDPITHLDPLDRLWVRHSMRCINEWSRVVTAGTDGKTSVIEATSTLSAIRHQAEEVRAVVAGEKQSPWAIDGAVPLEYLKLSDGATYAEAVLSPSRRLRQTSLATQQNGCRCTRS